jgi:hypothetical protein
MTNPLVFKKTSDESRYDADEKSPLDALCDTHADHALSLGKIKIFLFAGYMYSS